MVLQENLRGATPRPDINETIDKFCFRCNQDNLLKINNKRLKNKICVDSFNHYNTLNLKSRDLQFFTSIERRIQSIVNKYYPDIKDSLDEIYLNVSRAIREGRGWEQLVTNEDIIEVLSDIYDQTGNYIHSKYGKRYGVSFDTDTVSAVMATGLMDHLSRIQSPFKAATLKNIKHIISSSSDPAGELLEKDNKKRAYAISHTETGLAQSISEDFTMRNADPVKKYWIGRIDDKIRDSHLEATRDYNESNLLFFDQLFMVNGELMKHPRDYTASAKNTSNCRCYLGYVII